MVLHRDLLGRSINLEFVVDSRKGMVNDSNNSQVLTKEQLYEEI